MSRKSNQETPPPSKEKSQRGRKAGAIYFPRHSLKKALVVAETIWKDNGGEPYSRLSLAKSLDVSPTSGRFSVLLASSLRYGLTEGSYVSEKISLTPLGRSIVAPTAETDVNVKLREALLTPDIFKRIFERFDQKPIPKEEVFKNTLQFDYKIPQVCYDVLKENVDNYSIAEDIKGTSYLRLDRLAPQVEIAPPTEVPPDSEQGVVSEHTSTPRLEKTSPIPKQIFVAHGKNKRPLEQLKSILAQFQVPFKVAIDEPHKGRPIGDKVAELMQECTSGIFIFTADEECSDGKGNKVLRPSDNVVFELGAGTLLFGTKIVIFREEGVDFGSDFTDYGHITFDKDKLDAKALDLMKELIGLGFLQVTPT